MELKDLLEFVIEHGFTITFAVAVLFLGIRYGLALIDERFSSNNKEISLGKHIVFSTLKNGFLHGVNALQIPENNRSNIIKDMLKIKLKTMYIELKKLVREVEQKEMNNADLYHTCINAYNKIILSYKSYWEMIGIPEIAQDKFDDYHEPNIKELIRRTNIACYSIYISDQKEKVSIALDECNTIAGLLLAEGDVSISKLNGSLSKNPYERKMRVSELIKINL